MAEESLLGKSTEDAIQEPQKYQSSALIAAASQLKFDQKSGKKAEGANYEDLIKNSHELTKEEVVELWKTDGTKGLTDAGVEASRAIYGPNELTPAYEMPWYMKLLLAIFGGFFNQLLWAGGILCFISYAVKSDDITNLYLGIVLSVVVTITGIFGYFQESKSADIMSSFSKFKPKDTQVIRNGEQMGVGADDLVPGDLVVLENGNKLPADIRVIAQMQMKVDNASLTGESEAQERSWLPDEGLPIESKNFVFFGTLIVNGNGKGIVVATGDNTYMGMVAKLAQSTKNEKTPIAKEIDKFVAKVSGIAFTLGILFFALKIVKEPKTDKIVDAVILLIGIIVANVPEGLLATVTVSLTLTANRMGTKNVQVKNLESVETLGSTSVICSDKTGTLTTSVMTVAAIYFDNTITNADTAKPFNAVKEENPGDLYDQDGNTKTSLNRLVRIGALCNNATMTPEKDSQGNPVVLGSGTETAIFKFCDGHVTKMNPSWDTRKYRLGHEKLHEIPFNSANKWQSSIHKKVRGEFPTSPHEEDEKAYESRAIMVLKGAPERVLSMCTHYLKDGQQIDMTEEMKVQINKDMITLSKQGYRVLAFADAEFDPVEYDVNRPEPMLTVGNETTKAGQAGHVWVKYFGDDGEDMHEVALTALDKDGNKKTAEKHTFGDIYRLFSEKVGEKPGSIRLSLASNPDLMEYDVTLGDMNVGANCVIHATKGPYKFIGSSRENANWPFGLDGESGCNFVGLYAMIDPARPGVPEAVMKCQDAGIKVIMVTGDHPVTAHAIAKKVNIIAQENGEYQMTKQEVAEEELGDEKRKDEIPEDHPKYKAALVPGWELSALEEKANTMPGETGKAMMCKFWNEVLTKQSIVFARTSPEQKLRIVAACQERGGVVAVTGDGVNDSPALKKADIGVAMGITGTDVAKESADMILKDDNFASIVNGVEEGRIIFDNLKKSIAYTLSSNIPEITPFLFYTLANIPLPLTTVMILLIDLGTDLAPAISLAHEGAEADIMERAPRDQHRDSLVTWSLVSFAYLQIGMLQFLGGFYAYFVVLWSYGIHPMDTLNLDSSNLFDFAAADYTYMNHGYWMYCMNSDSALNQGDLLKHKNCFYLPDPSSFKCFWNDDTFEATSGDIKAGQETTACGEPSGTQLKDYFDDVTSFKDWYNTNEDYIKDGKAVLTRAIVLEGVHQQDSCAGTAADKSGDAFNSFSKCGYECLKESTCQGFKYSGGCKHYTDCTATGSDQKDKKTATGTAFAKNSNTAAAAKQAYDDFVHDKLAATTEKKAFVAFSKLMYKSMNSHKYWKTTNTYKQRTCYGIRDEGYDGAGAQYTFSPTGTDTPNAYKECDAALAGATSADWAYWKPANRPCSLVNNCVGVYESGPEGNTQEGNNSLYPMQMSTRAMALGQANTAYLISIIVVQWADLMICKTRARSLFEQGMTNVFMNYAIFFETVLGAVLVYVPFANAATGTKPLKFLWWCPAVPFSVMIYIYDEFRKGYIRYMRKPHNGKEATGCWLERNTYW